MGTLSWAGLTGRHGEGCGCDVKRCVSAGRPEVPAQPVPSLCQPRRPGGQCSASVPPQVANPCVRGDWESWGNPC